MVSRTTFCATVLAAAVLSAPAPQARASEAISKKAGCAACHAASKPGLGPSYADIAKRYKDDAAAAGRLAVNVRKGSKGTWGKTAMPPTGPDRLSDADLKAVIAWILKP